MSDIAQSCNSVDEAVLCYVSTIAKLVMERRNQMRSDCSKVLKDSGTNTAEMSRENECDSLPEENADVATMFQNLLDSSEETQENAGVLEPDHFQIIEDELDQYLLSHN